MSHIRGEAEEQQDNDGRDKLMGAAKKLADATTRMIDAAKLTAGAPQTTEHQIALRAAAEGLRTATSDAASDQLRKTAILRLEQAARQTAASASQTIAVANASEASSRNPQSQQNLSHHCQDVADYVPQLIASVRQNQQNPDDITTQMELLRVSSDILTPAGQLVHSGRAAVPSIGDQSASMQLSHTTQVLSESLAELRTSVTHVQELSSGVPEIDNAILVVRGLDGELREFGRTAAEGRLQPVPGETAEGSSVQLSSSTKAVGSALAQMLSATSQGDERYAGSNARDAAEGLRQLTGGIHGICATRRDAPSERLVWVC